jgi:uncharacterized phage protein gp47/JayE
MGYSRPTVTELVERILADIEGNLPDADARLRRATLNVLGRTEAGVAHGLYGYIDWIWRQVLPDTAESEILDRHAGIWGISRREATAAVGSITLLGANGSVVPAGTALQRSDGAVYAVDAEAVVAGGTAAVAVTSQVPGATGNADAATKLTLVSPIAGVTSTATVGIDGLAGGADAESDAALLARLLARIQEPPHGGARGDYVAWALEVAGVTRAWVYPLELGTGTVTVRFMTDDTTVDGIPEAASVAAVQSNIDAKRPVTADVVVVAPVAVPLAIEISGLNPATAAVKAAIEAEIRDLLRREAEPGGTILVSHLREAVSIAAGEFDHALVAPAADVAHGTGEIAVFGGIAWS